MTVLHRIARTIDDSLFDHMVQPLLDRTGRAPAQLAPALLGASLAMLLARILMLHGNGQLTEHLLDAAMAPAAVANLYRLSLQRAAHPSGGGARRASGVHRVMRLAALTVLHLQLMQVAVLAALPADTACLLLAEALFTAAFYVEACDPPRPPRRWIPQPARAPAWSRK